MLPGGRGRARLPTLRHSRCDQRNAIDGILVGDVQSVIGGGFASEIDGNTAGVELNAGSVVDYAVRDTSHRCLRAAPWCLGNYWLWVGSARGSISEPKGNTLGEGLNGAGSRDSTRICGIAVGLPAASAAVAGLVPDFHVKRVGAKVCVSAGVSEVGRSPHFGRGDDTVDATCVPSNAHVPRDARIAWHGQCGDDCGDQNDDEQLEERESVLSCCLSHSDLHANAPMEALLPTDIIRR